MTRLRARWVDTGRDRFGRVIRSMPRDDAGGMRIPSARHCEGLTGKNKPEAICTYARRTGLVRDRFGPVIRSMPRDDAT